MAFTTAVLFASILVSVCFLGADSKYSKELRTLLRRSPSENDGGEEEPGGNLQSILSRAIQDDGVVNPSLFLHELMNDPLPVPDFNISHDAALTKIDGQFRKMNLRGLRGFQIKKITVNLGQANASVVLHTPGLRLDGDYNLEGVVTFFNADSDGAFWMNVTNMYAYGGATLMKNEEGILEVDDVKVNVEVEDVELHFENLFGSSWSSFSNSILNQLSETIFEQVRTSMLSDLKSTMRKELNHRLKDIPSDFFQSNTSNIFDSLLAKAAETILDSGLDPVALPEFEETFHRRAFFLNVYGQWKASNGTLFGLATLHRTGDIVAIYENDSVIFEASLGFRNLTGMYNWSAHFMGVGPMGTLSLSLAHTSIFMRLKQDLKTGSKPKLLDLELDRIGQVWIDVQGLGSLDFLLEIIVNLMTNALKHSIAGAIIPPVREALQTQLNTLPVEFL